MYHNVPNQITHYLYCVKVQKGLTFVLPRGILIQIGFELYHEFLGNFGTRENARERSLEFGRKTDVTLQHEDTALDLRRSLINSHI